MSAGEFKDKKSLLILIHTFQVTLTRACAEIIFFIIIFHFVLWKIWYNSALFSSHKNVLPIEITVWIIAITKLR